MADSTIAARDCKERVALELAFKINLEERATDPGSKDRAYWFKLYHRCYQAVQGVNLAQS